MNTSTETLELVAEIHDAFDNATDNHLAQPIEAIEISRSTISRLQRLGFSNAAPIRQSRELEKQKELHRQRQEFADYYYRKYGKKFIVEEDVAAICKKYGLVIAKSSAFTGDIPEKNLLEIEAFQLEQKDTRVVHWPRNGWMSERILDSNMPPQFGFTMRIRPDINIIDDLDEKPLRSDALTAVDYFLRTAAEDAKERSDSRKVPASFEVVAGINDFDKSELYLDEDGYTLREIPDPIVLCRVRGGYLIISKWGREANDQLTVNAIEN